MRLFYKYINTIYLKLDIIKINLIEKKPRKN